MNYRSRCILFWSLFAALNCGSVYADWSVDRYIAVGHAVVGVVSAMVAVRWIAD